MQLTCLLLAFCLLAWACTLCDSLLRQRFSSGHEQGLRRGGVGACPADLPVRVGTGPVPVRHRGGCHPVIQKIQYHRRPPNDHQEKAPHRHRRSHAGHINTAPNAREPDPDQADRFCPISLGDWLELCRETSIPHVPAERLTTLLRDDYLRFDTQGEHQDRLREAFGAIRKARFHPYMVRFDCCAPLHLKASLARGDPDWKPDFGDLVLDDPRAFDIIFMFPREELPVWRRPWAKTIALDGYPVEYRAFVRDGEIAGISSYYPQRPLPEFPDHLDLVREYTGQLIAQAPTPFLWPLLSLPEDLDPDGVHFTADFMATDKGILFLEGGPPHELGAHPCCFQDFRVSGTALEDRNKGQEA